MKMVARAQTSQQITAIINVPLTFAALHKIGCNYISSAQPAACQASQATCGQQARYRRLCRRPKPAVHAPPSNRASGPQKPGLHTTFNTVAYNKTSAYASAPEG